MLGLVLLGFAGALAYWLEQPLVLRHSPVEVSIEAGTSARDAAVLWTQAGVDAPPQALYWWFRLSGQARKIRAGSYEAHQGITPRGLLDKMVRGDEALESLRLIDGWSLRQVRQALAKAPYLRHESDSLSEAQLAAALGQASPSLEGRFFPDTYAYSRGVSDLTVLRRARQAMLDHLATTWAQRQSDLPLASPDELLALASVVEKETGRAADRGLVAAVFVNRLRIGMPLQSDPTVIYGMGEAFDGNLRRSDLVRDTPYNSYTRNGLPPTPIAMPGLASLQAVAHPQPSSALYFVARGDGTSVFSDTLSDHNRAVNQFQRGRP